MDFYSQKSYSITDIEKLIENEVEENIHLDYKRAEALGKDDKKKGEITKDISAFANSDGGIIIYGLEEKDHKPIALSPIDGEKFTKEWLDQICSNIQQHIRNVEIFPIRINGEIGKSIYVVRIPRSNNAPHMATDHKYYKRNNFQSVAMEEYEVRDLFNRIDKPELCFDLAFIQPLNEDSANEEDGYIYKFHIGVRNISRAISKIYKLSIYLQDLKEDCDCVISAEPHNIEAYSQSILLEGAFKCSYTGKEPIFPNETVDFYPKLEIPYYSINKFWDCCKISIEIRYEGGSQRLVYNTESKEFELPITEEITLSK